MIYVYPAVVFPILFNDSDANIIWVIVNANTAIGPNTFNTYFIGVNTKTNKKVNISKWNDNPKNHPTVIAMNKTVNNCNTFALLSLFTILPILNISVFKLNVTIHIAMINPTNKYHPIPVTLKDDCKKVSENNSINNNTTGPDNNANTNVIKIYRMIILDAGGQ